MKFLFLIQARLGSIRRPGKTLAEIKGTTTLLESVYNRIIQAKEVTKDNIFVLTSDSPKDDPLVQFMEEKGIPHGRGSEQNIFGRFYDFVVASPSNPDYIIRVCCDNPFIDPEFIDEMTDALQNKQGLLPEYMTHADSKGHSAMATHYGFFTEAISWGAYQRANKMDLTDIEKEHVTPQFYKSGKFTTQYLPMPKELEEHPYRFTVDTENDLKVVRTIAAELPEKFSYRDVIATAQKHFNLMEIMASTISGDKKEGR